MNIKHIFPIALAAATLVSCEDYTEHNFGKTEELYQPQQVNLLQVKLNESIYETIADNETNMALAAEAGDEGETLAQLQLLKRKKRFFGSITPEKYLPAVMKEVIGNTQYYSITVGSRVTVTFDQEVETGATDNNAYVLATGELTASGRYLLVAKGEKQVLTDSDDAITDATSDNGYIYPSTNGKTRREVTRLSNDAIKLDETSTGYLFSIDKDGDNWLICNFRDNYLYLQKDQNTFSYIDDLGELEDEQYPAWKITYNAEDFTYNIVNAETGQVMLYETDGGMAGAYSDKGSANNYQDGYVAIELYKQGHANEIETTEMTFELTDEGWKVVEGYLSQIFKGTGSPDNAEVIYNTYGWSIEHEGSIGDLSYVWKVDNMYGLRASAYKVTAYAVKSWAISPTFNLEKAKNPVLIFSQAQKFAGFPVSQYLQVWISTNYEGVGKRSEASWKNISKLVNNWPNGDNWNFIRDTVSLADYVGKTNVNVAFRYTSTEEHAATWEVDSIFVKELKIKN